MGDEQTLLGFNHAGKMLEMLRTVAHLFQERAQLGFAFGSMAYPTFPEPLSRFIKNDHIMMIVRPVDAACHIVGAPSA